MSEEPRAADIASLVRDHHAAVYRYAYRLTGRAHDAEDLTQQTFLSAHQKLGQLRDSAASLGWLFAILRNGYRMWVRGRAAERYVLSLERNDVRDESHDDNPEIDGERLQAALDELDADFKLVVLMFYFEGCSYQAIADELRIPLGTVMSRLSRAKSRLRRRLAAPPLVSAASNQPIHAPGRAPNRN